MSDYRRLKITEEMRKKYVRSMEKFRREIQDAEMFIDGKWRKQKDCSLLWVETDRKNRNGYFEWIAKSQEETK